MLYPVGIKAEDFQKPLIGVGDLRKLDIVSVFDAVGEHAKKIGDAEFCTPSEWGCARTTTELRAGHCETDRPRLFRLWLHTSTVKSVAV
jgi:hypothetical protein